MNWLTCLALIMMGVLISFALDTNPEKRLATKKLLYALGAAVAMILYSEGRAML